MGPPAEAVHQSHAGGIEENMPSAEEQPVIDLTNMVYSIEADNESRLNLLNKKIEDISREIYQERG